MIEKIIAIAVILVCTVRVIGYGVYTLKDKNTVGGVGLFVIAFLVAISSVYFFLLS